MYMYSYRIVSLYKKYFLNFFKNEVFSIFLKITNKLKKKIVFVTFVCTNIYYVLLLKHSKLLISNIMFCPKI